MYTVTGFALCLTLNTINCAGAGPAAGSPFWVTTGYAGGAGQPAVNANPVPGFAAQVFVPCWLFDECALQ